MTIIYILLILIAIGVLLVYSRVDELVKKKRFDEWSEKEKAEEISEEEMVKFHGGFDKLLKEEPSYLFSKAIKKIKNAGIKLEGYEDFAYTFHCLSSPKRSKIMLSECGRYFLATPEEKKEMLKRYKNL